MAAGAAPADVAGLLADLDPARPPMRSLLATAGCRDLTERLRDAVRQVEGGDRQIVFGGHFSSGKSTLLNSLLGRPLLPTDDLPETGVPCVLRSGTRDRLQAVSAGGRAGLPFSTESIAREVSLVDGNGRYRHEVHDLQRLVVSLTGSVPPPGVLWIDSPGINDTEAMTERARSVARMADVLVWVVSSRQPLAEVEQEFLSDHIAAHGPSSVVFVVNVFLAEDSLAAWSTFLATRADRHRRRIVDAEICGPLTPTIAMVSARAGTVDRNGFGAPQVRSLLDELSTAGHGHALATRCHRTGQELRALVGELTTRIAAERTRLEGARRTQDTQLRDAAQRRQRFAHEITGAIARAYVTRAGVVERCADPIVAEIRGGALPRDGRFGAELTTAVTAVADELYVDLMRDARRIAQAAGLPDVPSRAATTVLAAVRPAALAVDVPSHPIGVGGRKSLGAIVGGTLGSFVLPGFGTVIGAALGAGAGALVDPVEAAIAKDRAGAETNAVAAARSAAVQLLATQQRVQEILTDRRLFPRPLPPAPDNRVLDGLRALQQRLEAAAARLRATTTVPVGA